MHHNVRISITKDTPKNPIFSCRSRKISARLWNWLFGKQKVVILVPGNTVDMVTITEMEGALKDA